MLATEIAAVLIVAYPDPDSKFRNLIGQLQIDWMMTQPRDSLNVEQGFWKGINSQNIGTAFTLGANDGPLEPELLVDYTLLFGPAFCNCRRDIRPYLSGAFELYPLTGELSDIEDDGDESGQCPPIREEGSLAEGVGPAGDMVSQIAAITVAQPSSSATHAAGDDPPTASWKVALLRVQLKAAGVTAAREDIAQWLVGQLLTEGSHLKGLLAEWCRCWERRIEAVDNYQDQMLVRSLFLSSATRLKALHSANTTFGDGFMLSDLEDWEPPDSHDKVINATATLKKFPEFAVCADAKDRLLRLIEEQGPDQVARDFAEQFFAQQAVILCRFLRRSPFFDAWVTRFTFEALYLEAICEGIPGPALTGDEMALWRSHRAALLNATMIGVLKLRNWQIIALLRPQADVKILTDWQLHVFLQTVTPARNGHTVSLTDLKVKPTVYKLPAVVDRDHQSLQKLLGNIDSTPVDLQPYGVPPDTAPVDPALVAPASTGATTPLQRRPSHASSGREASPSRNLTNTARRSNMFSGKSHFSSAKRAGSPIADTRAHKSARLGPHITRDDLQDALQELTQARHDIARELQHVKAECEKLRHDVARHSLPNPTIEQLSQNLQDVIASLNTHKSETLNATNSLTHTVNALESRVSSTHSALQDRSKEITENLQKSTAAATALGNKMENTTDRIPDLVTERLEHRGIIEAVLGFRGMVDQALHEHNHSRLVEDICRKISSIARDAIKEHDYDSLADKLGIRSIIQDVLEQERERVSAEKISRALPGQDGYLAQCVAPASWPSNQKAYESTLLRAGWLYINDLGNPDEGCYEDGGALDTVLLAFPGLDEHHISMALDHVHMQAYGRTLGRSV